jgi:hypothetical protein
MADFWLWQLSTIGPFVGSLCLSNFVHMQGELCNIRQPPDIVVKYAQPKPEEGCYRDGIFYPRCKDLEDPLVLYYHNLLKGEISNGIK